MQKPESRETPTSPWFPLYYALVVGGSLLLMGWSLPLGPETSWPLFLVWIGLILMADAAPVPLPGGGYITVSSTLDLAGILILGPLPTALAELVATLVLQVGIQRRPLTKAIFNATTFAGTVLIAGFVFRLLGGVPGGPLRFPDLIAPLIGMGAVYYTVNTVVVSTVIALTTERSFWRTWQVNYVWTIFHMVASLPIGAIFAVVYHALGMWGVVLFVLPLLLVRHVFKLYIDTRQDLREFAGALAGIIDEWDPYTRRHSERVSDYSTRLARELGLSERHVERVRMSGLLHDIGKISMSQFELITKPGPLTPQERERMCEHADIGADILGDVRVFRLVAPIVRYHHERMDGAGYHKLPATQVPMEARIVMVADAFDAMTSDRVYRKALSLAETMAELRRHAGTQFDRTVVGAMERLVERGEITLALDWTPPIEVTAADLAEAEAV